MQLFSMKSNDATWFTVVRLSRLQAPNTNGFKRTQIDSEKISALSQKRTV